MDYSARSIFRGEITIVKNTEKKAIRHCVTRTYFDKNYKLLN